MPETVQRRKRDGVLDRIENRRLLHFPQPHDIDKGRRYDARSGCVNIGCSPEDKPGCWDAEVEAGERLRRGNHAGHISR